MDIASPPPYFVRSGWVGIDSQYYGFRYAGTNAYDWTSSLAYRCHLRQIRLYS